MRYSGARINSCFALTPSLRKLCGSTEAPEALEICAKGGDCSQAQKVFPTFKTMWPYLTCIAKVLKCEPLDDLPASLYWLGNPRVFEFRPEHSPQLATRSKQPKVFYPFHTFEVLVNNTELTRTTVQGINGCMVSWGLVIQASQTSAQVKAAHMKLVSGKLVLSYANKSLSWRHDILGELHAGDLVAIHMGTIVLKINAQIANTLEQTTNRILSEQHLFYQG